MFKKRLPLACPKTKAKSSLNLIAPGRWTLETFFNCIVEKYFQYAVYEETDPQVECGLADIPS